MTNFRDSFWGPNGFEELKKYMKIGNEFCKELAATLAERSEIEINYSKSLSKVGQRLQKLSKGCFGGLSNAWFEVSLQFDSEAEMHKHFANVIHDEIIKPLRNLIKNQLKQKETIESNVDKSIKLLSERRTKDYKYRSRCIKTVKDIENAMYSLDEAQKGLGGKPPKQKDIQKLEDNLSQLKQLLEQSETKYHKACSGVELARQEYQVTWSNGCDQLQSIEEERIKQLDSLLKIYTNEIGDKSRKLLKMHEALQKINVNVQQDIETASKKYGTGPNDHEICLYDTYSENTKNMMNRERRIENLKKWSDLLNTDIRSQVKSKESLVKLRDFNREHPKFANNEIDIEQKLRSISLLQLLYEATLYKIDNAYQDACNSASNTNNNNSNENKIEPSSKTQAITFRYANQITTTYDKMGVPQSILKLAQNELDILYNYDNNSLTTFSSSTSSTSKTTNTLRHAPTAPPPTSQSTVSMTMPQPQINYSSSSSSPYSTIDDRKSSYNIPPANPPSYRTITNSSSNYKVSVNYSDDDEEWDEVSMQCVVEHDYDRQRDDELDIKKGQVIKIIEKRADGWWRGQLNGSIGLFPSTYVKEIK